MLLRVVIGRHGSWFPVDVTYKNEPFGLCACSPVIPVLRGLGKNGCLVESCDLVDFCLFPGDRCWLPGVFWLIAFYRIVCEQMCLKFVVSLVCGVVCVFVACLLVLGGLWSSTCIVTLLRMRGPLDDAWLYVPGLCPLVMSVVSV
jgi:hypothetical protein